MIELAITSQLVRVLLPGHTGRSPLVARLTPGTAISLPEPIDCCCLLTTMPRLVRSNQCCAPSRKDPACERRAAQRRHDQGVGIIYDGSEHEVFYTLCLPLNKHVYRARPVRTGGISRCCDNDIFAVK